jgi:hypothetical protein
MPKIFDLDALEREATTDPFGFSAGGKKFTATDVNDIDWQDLVDAGDDLDKLLPLVLGDDQYAEFRKIRGVPAWKLRRLVLGMQAHFGIGTPEKDDGSSGS